MGKRQIDKNTISVRIFRGTHKQLKVAAAEIGTKIQEIASQAIDEFLESLGNK